MRQSLGFSNTTNSAMTLFTALANDEMGETLETFRNLCHVISIYSLPYLADGLLHLGNITLSAFPNIRSEHGLCFATPCHLHTGSLQHPHDCALTRSSFAISRHSPLPSSLFFSSPPFPSHFHTLIFHALPFSEAISLISASSGLPHYHITIFNTSAIRK